MTNTRPRVVLADIQENVIQFGKRVENRHEKGAGRFALFLSNSAEFITLYE